MASNLTLIIGNKNYSSWSLRPWFFMQYHGLAFTEKRIALFTNTFRDELAEYDSDARVPVLQDGELIVWDTLAIMEYVSEQYLAGKGWPADVKARAVARSISAEMHSSFSHVRGEMPMNCRRKFSGITFSDDAQQEVQRIVHLWERCRNDYGQNGDWLFGEFSIADAMYAPIVLRFTGYDVPLSGTAETYVNTVLTHPAIQAWIEAGKQETEIIAEDEIDID